MKYGYLKILDGQLLHYDKEFFDAYEVDSLIFDQADESVNLKNVLPKLTTDDIFIVEDFAALTYSLSQLEETIKIFQERSIRLISIYPRFDTAESEHACFYEILTGCLSGRRDVYSSVNRSQIKKRQELGLKHGRPGIDTNLVEELRYLRSNKHLTYREISEISGVSLGTVYKYADCIIKLDN